MRNDHIGLGYEFYQFFAKFLIIIWLQVFLALKASGKYFSVIPCRLITKYKSVMNNLVRRYIDIIAIIKITKSRRSFYVKKQYLHKKNPKSLNGAPISTYPQRSFFCPTICQTMIGNQFAMNSCLVPFFHKPWYGLRITFS